ncbi:MAG: hypothetical protein EOM37_00925 [Proteobacteria bacterium]|jgi:predicted lipid carrier protein YhbT|nr:SCP2 sterol-binding domain-containing protein [Alphaproteobacteria bacterium]NCC02603.1 hypothetical protein [Pseudomonadota bacterium]
MLKPSIPIPLSRVTLQFVPRHIVERVTDIVWARMESRHPKLMENLEKLPKSYVIIDPVDVPFVFALDLIKRPISFSLYEERPLGPVIEPTAAVRGNLEALVNMLEGHADGDALFFSRDIQITGDTSIIVALRNTLDREEIFLLREIVSLCGPFAEPAKHAINIADKLASRVKRAASTLHNEMHRHKA